MSYEVIQIDADTWRVEEDNHVRFFVLKGEKETLCIDCGMNIKNAKDIAEELTGLTVKLLLTHADRDHVGSHAQFDTFYMHPSESSNFYNTQGQNGEFIPVVEGDILDLGNRPLEIIALPGHTPGSIAVLDVNKRILISGDPIQDGTIFMFGVQREYHVYLKSLKKLDAYRNKFDLVYPSHGSIPVEPKIIDELYVAMTEILDGKYEPSKAEFHNTIVNCYDTGTAKFLMDI